MFIFNMNLNNKSVFKIIFIILTIIILIMFLFGIYSTFKNRKVHNKSCISKNEVNIISSSNYTNTLKAVHDNLDNYVGTKIRLVGFVYRLYDFTDEQFVIARQMIISSDYQGVIVGFLCNLNGANKYKDGCWLEIEGTITKGNYHGEIPVIKIYKIKETKVPNDEYVYPPDVNYVPTSVAL